MALEEDRDSEGLRRFPDHFRAFLGGVGQSLAAQELELAGVRREDRLLADEAFRIRGDRLNRVRVKDHRQRDGPHGFPDRVERPGGVAQPGSDGDGVHPRGEFDDLPEVLAQQTMSHEGMHDERRRVGRDDGRGGRRRRDVDEVDADAKRTEPDEGGRPRVRTARDDEEAAVFSLVARGPRNRIKQKFARTDHRRHLRGDADIDDANPSAVVRRHALLHVMEGDRHRRPNHQPGPEAARDVDAHDRLAGSVHLTDEGGERFAEAPFGPDPQEGVDEKVRLGDRLFAPVQAREDLHVPQSLEVRLSLLRVELVRGAGEQDGHARLLRQMAGGDEAVSTVVPRSAQDQDAFPHRTEFRPSHLGDRLPRRLHEIEGRNAEVLGIPIEDAHLQRRNHGSRIRPSLVKHCPRG